MSTAFSPFHSITCSLVPESSSRFWIVFPPLLITSPVLVFEKGKISLMVSAVLVLVSLFCLPGMMDGLNGSIDFIFGIVICFDMAHANIVNITGVKVPLLNSLSVMIKSKSDSVNIN